MAFNLPASNLYISAFKSAKFDFSINLEVPIPIAFFKSVSVHNLTNLIQLSLFLLESLVLESIHSIILCLYSI